MLKLNTVLTALAVVLLGVLSWLTSTALQEIHDTHDAVTAMGVELKQHTETLDDHEKRLRQIERETPYVHIPQRGKQDNSN